MYVRLHTDELRSRSRETSAHICLEVGTQSRACQLNQAYHTDTQAPRCFFRRNGGKLLSLYSCVSFYTPDSSLTTSHEKSHSYQVHYEFNQFHQKLEAPMELACVGPPAGFTSSFSLPFLPLLSPSGAK